MAFPRSKHISKQDMAEWAFTYAKAASSGAYIASVLREEIIRLADDIIMLRRVEIMGHHTRYVVL